MTSIKSKMRKLRVNRIMLLASILLLTYLSLHYLQEQQQLKQKKKEVREIIEIYNREQKLNQELKRQQQKLSDDAYIAKLARDEFLLTGEGEIIFVLPHIENLRELPIGVN